MAEETAALATERTTGARDQHAGGASHYNMAWRSLPTLGEGLTRIGVAFGIGLITGIVWSIDNHQPPDGFFAAVGWALLLGTATLVGVGASVALERQLRGAALQHAQPAIIIALIALVALLLMMAAFVTLLPDTFTLGVPILFSLVLGLGVGFALGGMRLWGMRRDARWLFIGLGVAALFGVTLTFIIPAALSPQANGSLGFYGCLLYVLGLPGVALGSIAGGVLRMRAELEAYGYRTTGNTPPTVNEPANVAEDPNTAPSIAAEETTPQEPQEQPMTSDELVATLTAQRQGLLDALAGLSEEQLDQKSVVGDWSIKNALAHLTAWEEVVVRITPPRLKTGEYPEELRAINADEDANNAREIAESEYLTPTEQMAALAQARANLITMIHDLGDDTLAREHPWPEWDPPLANYFIQNIGGHDTEHSEAILAGVASLRASQPES